MQKENVAFQVHHVKEKSHSMLINNDQILFDLLQYERDT